MIKCRAKMIDGTPVTFEHHDCGPVYSPEIQQNVLRSAYTGEGFYVVSDVPGMSHSTEWRLSRDRYALERCGVDTATVERWEPGRHHVRWAPDNNDLYWVDGRWEPMFPPSPELKREPATPMPGTITYSDFGPRLPSQITAGIRQAINDGYMGWTGNGNPGSDFAERIYASLLAHLNRAPGYLSPGPPDPHESEVYRLTRMLIDERATSKKLLQMLEEAQAEADLSADMIANGAATLHSFIAGKARLESGSVTLPLAETVAAIWRAMEQARK